MACRTPQEIAAAHLLVPVEVRRVTRTADGTGGWTEEEATVAETVCSATALTGAAAPPIAERLGGRQGYRFRLPVGTDVAFGDVLAADGRRFEVVGVAAEPGGTLLTVFAGELL